MNGTRLVFLAAAAATVAACSGQNPAPQASAPNPAASAASARAEKSLAMYRQLLQSKSYELAGPIGQEIVANYPGTAAAKEVQQTLDDTVAKGKAIAQKRRLERLWAYQSGKESGGDQVTASIYSSEPVNDRVRLILRRHSAWGQSVYLFGSGKGFECGAHCTIKVRFDDEEKKMKAYAPKTGEPAIFIDDDKGFIAKMSKAGKISIDVTPKGKDPETLLFEVGGYDPAKFTSPPKS